MVIDLATQGLRERHAVQPHGLVVLGGRCGPKVPPEFPDRRVYLVPANPLPWRHGSAARIGVGRALFHSATTESLVYDVGSNL